MPAGTRGIAPVRAALSWTPVLAHAGNSRVTVFYVADKQSEAAYVLEWDLWREAGVSDCCRGQHLYSMSREGKAGGCRARSWYAGHGGAADVLGWPAAHITLPACLRTLDRPAALEASLKRAPSTSPRSGWVHPPPPPGPGTSDVPE